MDKIKKMYKYLPLGVRKAIHNIRIKLQYGDLEKELKVRLATRENPKVFLFDVCEHGNIGDHAILTGEINFIQKITDRELILIPSRFHQRFLNCFAAQIHETDLVVIQGGGFFGSVWSEPYDIPLRELPNNKIIVFPQTVFYSEDEAGKKKYQDELELFQNPNLTLSTREENSFHFATTHFYANAPHQCILVPDIVLSYETDVSYQPEDKVIFCFRADREKVRDDSLYSTLVSHIKNVDLEIEETDTVVNHGIQPKDGEQYLLDKLAQLSKGKFVITDRLHCMIFCTLTGTPCIAMDNSSGKVKGVYEKWLKQLNYIHFCENSEQVIQKTKELCEMETIQTERYSPKDLEWAFEPLKTAIQNWDESVK